MAVLYGKIVERVIRWWHACIDIVREPYFLVWIFLTWDVYRLEADDDDGNNNV